MGGRRAHQCDLAPGHPPAGVTRDSGLGIDAVAGLGAVIAILRRARLGAALGDADAGSPQQAVVQAIARLDDLHPGAGRRGRVLDLVHRPVQVRVEPLAPRGARPAAWPPRDTLQFLPGPITPDAPVYPRP